MNTRKRSLLGVANRGEVAAFVGITVATALAGLPRHKHQNEREVRSVH